MVPYVAEKVVQCITTQIVTQEKLTTAELLVFIALQLQIRFDRFLISIPM